MVDRWRVRDELHCVGELIRSTPEAREAFEFDPSGAIGGTRWEHVRQRVIQELEKAVREAAGLETGRVARQIFESEIRATTASSIEHADVWLVAPDCERPGGGVPRFDRSRFTILTYDPHCASHDVVPRTLGRIESFAGDGGVEGVVDPVKGERLLLRGSASHLETLAAHAGVLARVDWLPRPGVRRYRVSSARDGRVCDLRGRFGNRHALRIVEPGAGVIGLMDVRCVRDDRSGLLHTGYQIQLAPHRATPGLRWGLLAATVFAQMVHVNGTIVRRLLGR